MDVSLYSSATIENMRGCMRKLERDNAVLVKRVQELLELERNSLQKQLEMEAFKREFASKYEKLRDVLTGYAKKYPYPDNPVVPVVEKWDKSVPSGAARGGNPAADGGGGRTEKSDSDRLKKLELELRKTQNVNLRVCPCECERLSV